MVLKTYVSELLAYTSGHRQQRNLRLLLRFLLVLVLLVCLYSLAFHVLMLREGQNHSWVTGFYWTLTVMSTLGFGDITFHKDLGRLFSIVVLMTGTVFLLVLLPFTFIQFFYEPWMRAQEAARTPRRVDADLRGHVVITHYDVVTATVIRRLVAHKVATVVVVPQLEEAHRLQELGIKIVLGNLDDPETYRNAGVERAALVLATQGDMVNSSIAFTVREIAPKVPIICTATHESAVDVLQLAGASHVLRLEEMMGQALARRTLGCETAANIIGHVDGLLVAEAPAYGTPLVGKTLAEARLRQDFGVAVAGVWTRGLFQAPQADTRIDSSTVLVLAGEKASLEAYDDHFQEYRRRDAPVIIIGGGRVGRATARALASKRIEYRMVEKDPSILRRTRHRVIGDAADLEVLESVGIRETPTVIITPHQDEVNVYLTVYCRKLRPDVQILARTTLERNVSTLHRAGADFVLSYSSMGATMVLNLLRTNHVLMVAEGLDVFRVHVPRVLAGMSVAESGVRQSTGCSVVAVSAQGTMRIIPGPEELLEEGADLLLIGTLAAQDEFFRRFPDADTIARSPLEKGAGK